MRFLYDGKTYAFNSLDELSLLDVMRFNAEAADLKLGVVWADVEFAANEVNRMKPDEAERHPQKHLIIAACFWVARRAAGEDVTFTETASIPGSKFDIAEDPQDHKPGKPKGAKKPPKASAPVAEPPASEPDAETTPTT